MGITVIYENANGQTVEFSKKTGIRLVQIDGLSSNDIDVSSAQSTGQIGASLTGQKVQPKSVTFEGRYRYDPTVRRKILDTILPTVSARIRYIDDQAGIDVYLEGVPTQTPDMSTNPYWQSFQFTMFCAFPYWKAIDGGYLNFVSYEARFKFPYTFSSTEQWKISEKVINQLSTIINSGSVPIGFVARFMAKDTVVGLELLKVVTQEVLKFSSLTMQIDDELVISTIPNDCYCYLIRDGEEINAFPDMDFDASFFQLDVGKNPLRFDADSGLDSLELDIEYAITYAGV